MSWTERIGGLLKQYSDSGATTHPAPDVNAHFDQVAQAAPAGSIGEGLAALFRSDGTPSFAETVSKLFAHSNAEQKSGLLNRLMGASSSGVLSQILSKLEVSGAAAVGAEKGAATISSDQAQRVPPEAVREIAAHAERNSPNVVDNVSLFYAQHPALIKTLGSTALSTLLAKVAERH